MLNFQHSIHSYSAAQTVLASHHPLHINSLFLKPHGKYLLSNNIPSMFLRQTRRNNNLKHSTIRTGGCRGIMVSNNNVIRGSLSIQPFKERKSLARLAVPSTTEGLSIFVKGIVTVQTPKGWSDEYLKKTFSIELVSSEVDPNTGSEKEWVKGMAKWWGQDFETVQYQVRMNVPLDYGEIGAVVIQNEHEHESFIKNIVFEGFPDGKKITISCDSWVHSKNDNPFKRIFFTGKSYLPSQTPEGLKRLRELDLEELRGIDADQGERKVFERIYDYDVYNDLADPDKDPKLARPVLGGTEHPYPRRCRTGRPRTKEDKETESRSGFYYVPRDEAFSEVKKESFGLNRLRIALETLIPGIEQPSHKGFPYFTAIDKLFDEGIHVSKEIHQLKAILPRLVKDVKDEPHLLFEPPELMARDKFAWLKDEEFSRHTLAGINPYSIRLVQESEWPFRSSLDPEIYGPPESKITEDIVERQIGGSMTVKEALQKKKLFMLDYHDLYLPYVHKVRELGGTTLYGSRTLFYLTENDTLRPIAIELTCPPNQKQGKRQWKAVISKDNAISDWLWKLAKAHVSTCDIGYHQLVSHWLRTHCCTEPYVIATNRQLSAIHPVYRLLHPHFRYTMEMNVFARESLVNAGGIIETNFSPGKYSLELSSVAYDQQWRFDMEALPADLIRRGMAVEDPCAEHGLKLTIKDYPFANDGLDLWDAIKTWVTEYVNHYYTEASLVQNDTELQAWWTEIRTKGHRDKKDEPWWPKLETADDLINILTIMIWVSSGHHAAVNFGQYHYGGYFPNKPTIARTNYLFEDLEFEHDDQTANEKVRRFLEKPEDTLLECFPTPTQAITVMVVYDVLSNHSPDEEYIGTTPEPSSWDENPIIKEAYERFGKKLEDLESIIDQRNANFDLRNRTGAGVVPYEFLKPRSGPGVTGKGVPNSISI